MLLAVSPTPAIDHTFLVCSFMNLAFSITFPALTVNHIFPECLLILLAVSPAPAVDAHIP